MTIPAGMAFRHDLVATAGQTNFAFTFRIHKAEDIAVYVNQVLKALTTHYSVTINFDGTGTVVFSPGLVVNDKVVLRLNPEISQLADYIFNDKFPEETHEKALDRVTAICLRLDDDMRRALKFSRWSTFKDFDIAEPTANKFLKTNGANNGIELVEVITSGVTIGGTPTAIGPGAASEGVSSSVARVDHQHLAGLIAGAIPFATGANALGIDDAKLFWDNVNKRLNVGKTGGGHVISVRGNGIAYEQGTGASDAIIILDPTNIRLAMNTNDISPYSLSFIKTRSGGNVSNSDIIGQLLFNAKTGGTEKSVATFRLTITDSTSGSEDALFQFFVIRNGTQEEFARFDAPPADGDTAFAVMRRVGAAFTLQRVSMGATDSGGAGFKYLRVPN